MAVSKIRKISSWTMLAVNLISLVLIALFFFGGIGDPWKGEYKNPVYTGELLICSYLLLGLCAAGMILFGIVQFGGKLKSNPKAALLTLGILVAFAVLLFIAYSMGDGSILTTHLNPDSQKFNTAFWLKTTDMWLYAMYILAVLCIFAILWGSVQKIFRK